MKTPVATKYGLCHFTDKKQNENVLT